MIASRSSRAISASTFSGWKVNAERNITRAITMNTSSSTTTIGARLSTKSLKLSPDLAAMMMLGGSPIRVAVPPMLEAITSAIRNGTGGASMRSHSSSVTGATSRTVVTLSSRAEATAVSTISITMIANGRPLARLAAQIATNSKTPV